MSNINDVKFNGANLSINVSNSNHSQKPNVIEFPKNLSTDTPPNLKTRIVTKLNHLDVKLETVLPNCGFQNDFDKVLNFIEGKIASLKPFNDWINSNGQGDWYKQLATALVKLPMRAVRNVVQTIYQIIKGLVYTTVHPLKALNAALKLLVNLVDELTKPENWSKMGVGMLGSSFGQSLVSGNPISIIGVGIGAALLIMGLTIGSMKFAYEHQELSIWDCIQQHLKSQLKDLPESLLTGFCMGLLVGGIQKILQQRQLSTFKVTDKNEARLFAEKFIKENNLTPCDVELTNGKIILRWYGSRLRDLEIAREDLFLKYLNQGQDIYEFPDFYMIELDSTSANFQLEVFGTDLTSAYEEYNLKVNLPLSEVGINGGYYPLPPDDICLGSLGSTLGAQASLSNES